jgi:hypothetical protein
MNGTRPNDDGDAAKLALDSPLMIPFRSSMDHIVGMGAGKPCMPAERPVTVS